MRRFSPRSRRSSPICPPTAIDGFMLSCVAKPSRRAGRPNVKRVYRVMKVHGLLLQPTPAARSAGTGAIAGGEVRNTRWWSHDGEDRLPTATRRRPRRSTATGAGDGGGGHHQLGLRRCDHGPGRGRADRLVKPRLCRFAIEWASSDRNAAAGHRPSWDLLAHQTFGSAPPHPALQSSDQPHG